MKIQTTNGSKLEVFFMEVEKEVVISLSDEGEIGMACGITSVAELEILIAELEECKARMEPSNQNFF